MARLGALLSRELGAELQLVHVMEPVLGSQGVGGRLQRMLELEGREMLDGLTSEVGCDGEASSVVRLGDPLDELLRLTGEAAADLLIVGSRGRGPLKAALLGSTSVRLATRSACPVVVVPPAASRRLERGAGAEAARAPTLVCGVDGSARGYEAVSVAAQLLARVGGRLHLVHAHRPVPPLYGIPDVDGSSSRVGSRVDFEAIVNAESRSRRRLLERAARLVDDQVDVSTELASSEPVTALEEAAERRDADLIVVASRGRGPLASALLGSTSTRLASSAARPVLIVPGPWTWSELQGEKLADRAAHAVQG